MKLKGDQTLFISSEENGLLARLVHRVRISGFQTFSTWPSPIYSHTPAKGVQLTEIW
jgi:hypothetical protein